MTKNIYVEHDKLLTSEAIGIGSAVFLDKITDVNNVLKGTNNEVLNAKDLFSEIHSSDLYKFLQHEYCINFGLAFGLPDEEEIERLTKDDEKFRILHGLFEGFKNLKELVRNKIEVNTTSPGEDTSSDILNKKRERDVLQDIKSDDLKFNNKDIRDSVLSVIALMGNAVDFYTQKNGI